MGDKKARFWRSVFRQVMTRFDDIRSVQGTNSCAAFYNGLKQEGGRTGYNLRVVRVLPSDFICDVELAARRALNANEHFYFKTVYLKKDAEFEDELKKTISEAAHTVLRHTVQEKLGKMLQQRRIYPIHEYMKAVDLR